MKRWGILMVGTVMAVSASWAAGPEAPAAVAASSATATLSLLDCYRLAVQHSEDLQISDEDIIQAHERYRQAVGSILPDLRFQVAETIQDTSGVPSNGFNQRERRETKFMASQPIFSGFKEFAAMSGFKAEERQQRALRKRNASVLFQSMALTFYQIVQLDVERQDVDALIKLTDDRVKELRGRVRLGKSRESEIVTANAQLASQRAQLQQLVGAAAAARDQLSFLTGADMRSVALNDDVVVPNEIFSEDQAIRQAMSRADIQAQSEDVTAKRSNVKFSRAGYWPTLGVIGDYYLQRPGFQKNIDWDLLFNLDVPIYQGGAVGALVAESQSILHQSELTLARLQRQVASDVRQAHTVLASSILETAALKDAYEQNRRSYEMQSREYRLGLVNNLDVLVAMNAMQQSKQDYDRSFAQTKLNWLSLRTTIEDVPEPNK